MSQEEDRTHLFHLADRALDGQLALKLRKWRAAGLSLRSIQYLLHDELGIKPALETIRRWIHHIEQNGAAA